MRSQHRDVEHRVEETLYAWTDPENPAPSFGTGPLHGRGDRAATWVPVPPPADGGAKHYRPIGFRVSEACGTDIEDVSSQGIAAGESHRGTTANLRHAVCAPVHPQQVVCERVS